MKKIIRVFLIVLLSVLSFNLVSCGDKETHDSNLTYIYPEKIKGNLDNPGMGWVGIEEVINLGQIEVGSTGNFPEVGVISLESSWAYLEPEKDVFDFTMLDQAIEYWSSQGKRFNFRIMTDALVLGITCDGAPKWLLEDSRVGYEVVELTHDGSNIFSEYKVINVKSEYYQERLAIFLDKLVEKYGELESLETVEVRGYGCWGEWHSGYSFNTMQERTETLDKIYDLYKDAWAETGKCMVVSCTWDPVLLEYYENNYEAYYTASIFDYVMKDDKGTFRRDAAASFLFNNQLEGRLIREFINSGKKLPLMSEFYYRINDMANSNGYGYDLLNSMNEMLYKGRPNYSSVVNYNLIQLSQILEDGYGEYFDYVNEKIGYRLAVDEAVYNSKLNVGDTFYIKTTLSNSGVGRFWFNDRIKYYITNEQEQVVYEYIDENHDIRNLMLGDNNAYYSSFKLPKGLSEGKYKISIAIVDETGNPHIKLAQTGNHESKIYKLGEFSIDSNYNSKPIDTKISASELKNYSFDSNSIYSITFNYKSFFDINNYKMANEDGYEIRLKTKNDKVNQLLHKFKDVSGERGVKTITFDTGKYEDYYLELQSDNFGDLQLFDIYIEKITSGLSCNFDGDNIFSSSNGNNSLIYDDEESIDYKSLLVQNDLLGDNACVTLKSSEYKLKPNTTYSLAFKSRAVSEYGIGGHASVYLNSASRKSLISVYDWYDGIEEDCNYNYLSFTTDSYSDNELSFGMFNSGKYVIDEFIIFEHDNGQIIEAEHLDHERNVIPTYKNHVGIIEDFEDEISLFRTTFSYGFQRWGQLTTDSKFVIDGNTSFLGVVPEGHTTGDWMEFCYSNRSKIKLEPNTTYKLEFDYKLIDQPITESGENGFFYVLSRSDSLFQQSGQASDCMYHEYSKGIQEGNYVRHFSCTFTTGNAGDFFIVFGQFGYGTIVLDNILISQTN